MTRVGDQLDADLEAPACALAKALIEVYAPVPAGEQDDHDDAKQWHVTQQAGALGERGGDRQQPAEHGYRQPDHVEGRLDKLGECAAVAERQPLIQAADRSEQE